MTEAHTSVQVPNLLNEPALLAVKELEEVGLSWKLTGDVEKRSHVKSQTPFPGHSVPKGTVVHLYCVGGPLP